MGTITKLILVGVVIWAAWLGYRYFLAPNAVLRRQGAGEFFSGNYPAATTDLIKAG